MSLALLAQAASYQFRQKLPKPYNRWNALHLSEALFKNIDGDIRVKNDTIIVTCYNAPGELNLQQNYQDLPLFDFLTVHNRDRHHQARHRRFEIELPLLGDAPACGRAQPFFTLILDLDII